MLTPVSTARSFSEFLPDHSPATTDDPVHIHPSQRSETLDQVSYFDTIMRVRCRRPIRRCRRRSYN